MQLFDQIGINFLPITVLVISFAGNNHVQRLLLFCAFAKFAFFLIGFINNNLISIAFKMLTYSSSFKTKPKTGSQLTTHYMSTLPNEAARRTINNPNMPQKQKTYRKVITEANEPEIVDNDGKRGAKGIKFPLKTGSPGLKKNLIVESTSPTNKLCFNNAGKIKRVKKTGNQKAVTETGPVIQRVINTQQMKPIEKEKHWDVYQFKKQFEYKKDNNWQSKKENIPVKKLLQSKSGNLYMKARMNTEGTIDSTPSSYSNSCDVELIEIIGQGTFGKVFKGRIRKTGQIVAVKKVFQDPKYKNREIEIVGMLRGDFLMKVLGSFTTFQQGGQFLNIVMAFYDGDLYGLIRQSGRKGLSTMDIKIISYQIFRGILFAHQLRIAHRDIKPHNVLYKGKKIAICDFGSAKILSNEPNLPYICSRCYRAPELIFGATHYSTMIDIWSIGCILLEMIQGSPLFVGQSSVDHLIEVIKVLGTPTKTQVIDMNPNYDLNDYKFPKVKKRQWNKIFPKADPLLLDLISQIMIYSPKQRLNAAEALAHEFYDELREEPVYRQISKQYGLSLFSFLPQELKGQEHLLPKLIPSWFKQSKEYNLF